MAEFNDVENDEIDVEPTKALFVDMLTRDILLNRAVLDLIDNSVDGARRLRPETDGDYTGLEINVALSGLSFAITDNCGGIGIDLARHYAFRFGRAKGMPSSPNSVGQFGVGMKRALFKFGRLFKVTSTTQHDRFELEVDVDKWVDDPDVGWRFKFASAQENLELPISMTGTEIKVDRLNPSAAVSFAQPHFCNALGREIENAQQEYINRGLRIVYQGRSLLSTPWRLLLGAGLAPSIEEYEIKGSGPSIFVRIFAGVEDSDPARAGWYIFCNGRMIVESDQSPVTGWSMLAQTAGVAIPKYHNQFARFRGYVFIDCLDASLLPWNTTKTGVDSDSPVYQNVLGHMLLAMRPVIDFLNKLDAEGDRSEDERPFTSVVRQAPAVPIKTIAHRGAFVTPSVTRRPSPPPTTSIQFSRLRKDVDRLKEVFDADSNSELGGIIFDLALAQHT